MSRGSAIVPPGLESLALTVRKTKQPAVGDAHSAGFAIRSPRGMGEPHDYAPRSSQHLSWIPICRAEGWWQGAGQEAGISLPRVTSKWPGAESNHFTFLVVEAG